jgi:hypothetical protein
MLVAFAVVQSTISLFQSGVSSFSCLLICCSNFNLDNLIVSSSVNSVQVDSNC